LITPAPSGLANTNKLIVAGYTCFVATDFTCQGLPVSDSVITSVVALGSPSLSAARPSQNLGLDTDITKLK
jgi:hypothetical protein